MPIISIGAQQPRQLAPGAVARMEYEAKILRNPFNKRNRQLLHDNYGIQLPQIERQQQHQQERTVIKRVSFIFQSSLIRYRHHRKISSWEKQRNLLEYYH